MFINTEEEKTNIVFAILINAFVCVVTLRFLLFCRRYSCSSSTNNTHFNPFVRTILFITSADFKYLANFKHQERRWKYIAPFNFSENFGHSTIFRFDFFFLQNFFFCFFCLMFIRSVTLGDRWHINSLVIFFDSKIIPDILFQMPIFHCINWIQTCCTVGVVASLRIGPLLHGVVANGESNGEPELLEWLSVDCCCFFFHLTRSMMKEKNQKREKRRKNVHKMKLL